MTPISDGYRDVPAPVRHYVDKSVAERARRSGWSAAQREDAAQEIIAQLWEQEPDLAVWSEFSNRRFATPGYDRFHALLIRTIKAVLDKQQRTPRVDLPVLDAGPGTDPPPRLEEGAATRIAAPKKRRRQYLPPDRSLTGPEVSTLISREPPAEAIDLMLDLERSLAKLPPSSQEVVRRKTAGETWATIAADLGLSVQKTRQLHTRASEQLARALKGYAEPGP